MFNNTSSSGPGVRQTFTDVMIPRVVSYYDSSLRSKESSAKAEFSLTCNNRNITTGFLVEGLLDLSTLTGDQGQRCESFAGLYLVY